MSCQNQVNINEKPNIQPSISLKVAAIFPRDIETDSWSHYGYDGLLAIQSELGAQIDYLDQVDIPSPQPLEVFERILQKYAKDGYELIICHGEQFIKSAEIVASQFPRTKFVIVGVYPGNNKNVAGVIYRTSEGGYLVGVAAGLATKTNKISFLGGKPNNKNKQLAKFTTEGVREVNPNAKILIDWTDSFTDETKAKELAQKAIDAGADVLIPNASQSNPALIKMAQQAGIKAIGINQDYHDLAPDTVITSFIPKISTIYVAIATLAIEGNWQGKQYKFGLKEDGLEMTTVVQNFPPQQLAKFLKIQEDIKLDRRKILEYN